MVGWDLELRLGLDNDVNRTRIKCTDLLTNCGISQICEDQTVHNDAQDEDNSPG